MSGPTVSVVTVAYGAEPWLERSVEACLASTGVSVDVVLVDNGCTDGAVDRLRSRPGITVVNDGTNTGFAEGCNIGVRAATGMFVALVNPDALVAPDALANLIAVAGREDVGIATASVRLADRPELLNAAGLSLHFLGFSWAGHFEEPAIAFAYEHDVIGGSGAGMAMRRDRWHIVGGLCAEFFAYYEDCDFALRVRQHGWRVVYVPDAVVLHRYEFSRNAQKFFLVERNRLVMVLSLWSTRSLVLLAPMFAVLEVLVLVLAIRQGWGRAKVRSWWWLLRHARWIAARRAALQSVRTVSDRALVPYIEERLDPGNFPLPPALTPLQAPLRGWWLVVRRLL
jgi:GT2 family glycosyltransferase